MGVKTIVVLVLVVLLLWYVLANNATAQAHLTSMGVAKYIPIFPCPTYAQNAGYCDASGAWHAPLDVAPAAPAPTQPMTLRREGFSPKLMHVAGFCGAN